MRKRKKKSSRLIRILIWIPGIVVVLAASGIVAGYLYMQNYMKSDALRAMLATQLGRVTRSHAEVESLTWSGTGVYVPKITLVPLASNGWKNAAADGVQATIDLGTLRARVWTVTKVDMDWLRLETGSSSGASSEETAPPPIMNPGWLQSWLPNRTDIGGVNVQSFEVFPAKGTSGVEVSALKLHAQPAKGESAWLLRGEGGTVRLPGIAEAFKISSATARVDGKTLSLNDSILRWTGDSEVTARGDLFFEKGKGWNYSGRFSNLDTRHILSEAWRGKVSGVLEGDYTAASQATAPALFKSKMRVKSGIVQNLPVLDRIADFTRTERFRRVVLDEASGDVERQGDRTKISKLVLQSNGLMRIEGDLLMQGSAMNGTFLVGVSPETLRWIPGAQGHVFTESNTVGPPGFVWTTVHLSGAMDDPKEDLSNRLLAAAGKALLLDTPMSVLGTGADVIGKTGLPAKAVLDGATDAVEKSVDVLKSLVPFIK